MPGIYRYEAHFISIITGIENIKTDTGLSIYPNPAMDQLTIGTPVGGQLSVQSLSGQQLIQQTVTIPATTLDVKTLPAGVYVVKVADKKGVQVGKFIKQ
jgi:hypothetical protein